MADQSLSQHQETDDNGERDSAYGDEVDSWVRHSFKYIVLILAVTDTRCTESITTSIAESVQAYKFEHGRRYYAYQDGKYALPNDDAEIIRLGGLMKSLLSS
jgi:hypothetical protein